ALHRHVGIGAADGDRHPPRHGDRVVERPRRSAARRSRADHDRLIGLPDVDRLAIRVFHLDADRVEVNHSDRETVDIRQADQAVMVRSRSTRGGPPRSLDYAITVPGWMAVAVSGTYADVTM